MTSAALAPIYSFALLALALHLVWAHFAPVLAGGLLATALLAVTTLTCTGIGRLLLKAFVGTHLSESERTLVGGTLGLGLLSQLMLGLAAVGALRPAAVVVLAAGLWVVGFTEMREVLLSLRPNRALLGDRPAWTLGLAGLLGLAFWTAWTPPHHYDSLVYHLELPALYVRHGGLVAPDYLPFAHFPQNAEMLFSFALLLGSDVLAQLFSWLAMALSVWWVFEMGRREAPLSAAMLACVLLASQTAVMLLAGSAYVETFVMLWLTAAVFCFLRWRDLAGPAEGGSGWLALAGVFAGLGVGTKYYAAVCPAILTLFLLLRRSRRRDVVLFTGAAALVGCPWLVKNWIVTGNPVFPFLYKVMPYWGPGAGREIAERYFRFFGEYAPVPGRLIQDLVAFPYLAASGSTRFGGGADVLGDLGWAPAVALVPAALLAAVRNRELRRVTLYCALHAVVWYSTAVVLRFLVVLLPLYYLAAAAGLHSVWDPMSARGRALLGAALAAFLALNLGLFLHVQSLLSSWSVLVAAEPRDAYLSRRLEYYPCARWAREGLDKKARILLVGESRGYHLEQDHVPTAAMAPNRYVDWAGEASSPAGLADRLRREGFTHLLAVPREFARIQGYGTLNFTERGRRNWEQLEPSRAKPVFKAPGCAVLELAP